jgi:DNA-directed RNA polymerase subunit M/transcription elongation factor TFIIS
MMYRDTDTGEVIFKCKSCGNEKPGAPEDYLIHGEFTKGATNFSRIINENDKTCEKIRKNCECGMDIVNQIFIESTNTVYYGCDACGRRFTD